MKNLFTLFILLAFISPILASNVLEDSGQNNLKVLYVEEEANGKHIDMRISDPAWADVGFSNELQVAEFPGEGFTDEQGQPQVPVIGRMVRLPISGGAHIEILDSHFSVYNNIDYAAFAGTGLAEELEGLDASVDRWYPENIIEIGEPAIMKDFRVANVTTCPIQVNPARRQVRVYDRLEYRVEYDQSTNENSLDSWPTRLSETFLPFYRQILDWSETELDQYELYRGGVQLVCKEAWLEEMNDWITWKKQKGWDVQLISDADIEWTRLNIVNELRDRYDASETKFDHIVIVGDATAGTFFTPPGSSGDYYGAGDHYYGLLAGGDQLLDVGVGRISVETANMLRAYVRKVISYERDTYRSEDPEDYGWYKRGSVAAGSASSGISTVYVARYARHVMLESGYTQVDTAFYNDGHGSVNNRIINQINNGVSFHLYRGFVNSGIENEQIFSMTNTYMLPVVIDITCGRGNWADGTSINEAYMRAGNVNSPRGAIAAASTATSSTHTRFNNALGGGGAEAVFVKKVPTIGQMLIGAKYNLWQNFWGFQSNEVRNFNQWFNLMGDPTVWIFTDIPDSTISFEVDEVIELGTRGIEVEVQNSEGPLLNAWVTFYKSDDNEEVISKAVTDRNGYVLLDIPCEYPGEAVLTVTAYNHRPVQQRIQISTPEDRLGVVDCTILDDGTSGTRGNGNGVAEAGETVGLLFEIYNFGESSQSNIDINVSSNDDNILSVTGNPVMAILNAGASSTFNTSVLVEIDVNAPDHWISPLTIDLDGSADDYDDVFGLHISAPRLIFMESSDNILPGEQGNITFNVMNVGGADISNSNLTLVLNDVNEDWITIENVNGTLGSIQAGDTLSTSSFTLTGHLEAFEGYNYSAILVAQTAANQRHQIPVKIQMGTKDESDPEGPDAYGYFAYDDEDAAYIMSPTYNWMEIDPTQGDFIFEGTEIVLDDHGEDQDASAAIDLPFEFIYYGETYNTITVCSNGWIAMGNQEGMSLQRNWVIPSPLGPWAMIAPYWDDLIITGSGGVYYHYVEDEGKFIVEWSNVSDAFMTQTNTFQVVLLENNEAFPTPTGDNEFIFNFKDVNPSPGGYADVPYYTTGIENADQQDGLQLCYYNVASSGTATIEDERSILFSTRTTYSTGTVTGTVTLLGDDTPVQGVIVSASTYSNSDTTDVNGNYSISVVTGYADIMFRKNGYETTVVEDVEVVESESVTVDAQMALPVFSVTPETLTFNMDPGEIDSHVLTMNNSGNAPLTYSLDATGYDPDGQVGGDIGDQVGYINFWSGNIDYLDCSARGDTIFVLARPFGSYNSEVRLFNLDGTLLNTYILNFMNEAVRIQVTDDIVIIEDGISLKFYTFDDGLTQDSMKTIPNNIYVNDFAVDYEDEKIFFAAGRILYEYDFDMHIEQSHLMEDYSTAIDVLPGDPDGYTVHILGYSVGQGGQEFKMLRYNPATQNSELMFDERSIEGSYPQGVTLIKMNAGLNYLVGILYPYINPGIGFNQYISDLSWFTMDHESGLINAESSLAVSVQVDATSLLPGTYNTWITIRHNAVGGSLTIPTTINIGPVDVNEEGSLPKEWALESIYPNPFNPTATVKFSLQENAVVNARLFNILGQQVAVLANRPMQAGYHTLTIDGGNLSSGVYFLKFNAGPLNTVQKVVLMK